MNKLNFLEKTLKFLPMTIALEKGLQWERALDLFDEMKAKQLAITVVSYGSAISACEKGLQYRQCLEYLDEMTELG